MFLKLCILVAAVLAVAYAAAIEPLDLTALEDQSQEVQVPEQRVREKRFLLAKKALLLGGAAGLGIGLAKGAYFGHHHQAHIYPSYYSYPVYYRESYPVYYRESYPVYYSQPYQGYGNNGGWSGSQGYPSQGYGNGGGNGGGWSGSQAYASAQASSW